MLKSSCRNKTRSLFVRAALVVGALSACQLVLLGQSAGLVLVILVLLLISFPLVYLLMKPPVVLGIIASVIIVFLLLFMEQTALRLSGVLVREGASVVEFSTPDTISPTHGPAEQIATIPTADQSQHFEDAYMERRHWMEDLSGQERQRYCEQTAAFLIEEGFANNAYSIAAIQTVDQVNLSELVAFFNVLLSEKNQEASLDLTLGHLVGLALSDGDVEMLTVFVSLCVRRDIERAMEIAREEVQVLRGESEFAATVLLAMVQAGTGYPIDLLLAEQRKSGPLEDKRLRELASNHWKRSGVEPPLTASLDGAVPEEEEPVVEPIVVMAVTPKPESEPAPKLQPKPQPKPAPKPEPVPEPEPFIKITTHLGVVYVPDDEMVMHEWIAAANGLQIRGYVALGNEVVILKMDGGMLRKDQEWIHRMKEYDYHFKLEKVQRNMVTIRANGREFIQ